ncbi:AraC family transcriptional regulator [Flavobacterium circumlabens]|uniref:AraC family transcriptional regulator n=1 Tax=Flavobacterium circumlabens TaxID=2133765 RepID=A0A4Y7UEI3_9FLAO|nr:helix-turn-helix domain-containing protein [Flavobacterium circumlabens]TCN59545.1 AraC-like DNA-binding protein [Flavobacterium circumlabens]TEB44837.1 AraC family transcriptional regulator [Flavobacterium circumlabens]
MNPILEALISGPSFFLAFLIYVNLNKVNIKANRWLGTFILCIFLIQIDTLFQKSNYFAEGSFALEILSLASLIIAPVFYFSVVYYAESNRKWKAVDNLHFLFAILMLVLIIISHFLENDKIKTASDKKIEYYAVFVFGILFCVMVTAYCIAAYIKIDKYQKKLYLYSSNIEAVNLNWLKQISICVLVLAFIWLADILFQLSDAFFLYDYFSSLVNFFGICFIAFHSLKQKEVFPFNNEQKNEINAVISETSIVDDSRKKLISDEKLIEMKLLLTELMEKEKPFLDFELSLLKLASLLNTSPHLLSYIINTGFNENFYQFINRYRIEQARKMILDPKMENLNLIGIAYESGFNSKTVFNTTFKKITNQTPSEFKKASNKI